MQQLGLYQGSGNLTTSRRHFATSCIGFRCNSAYNTSYARWYTSAFITPPQSTSASYVYRFRISLVEAISALQPMEICRYRRPTRLHSVHAVLQSLDQRPGTVYRRLFVIQH